MMKREEFKKLHRWINSEVWRGDPEALEALSHIKGIGDYKSKKKSGGRNHYFEKPEQYKK
ncbi:hypothetical protein [Shouchella miscanthi]|uniref:Uncharacterized protein n=1 Tax=Shouchella miscanthi TaxID=2598861 RepID=A0ABU6NMR0_9BACI|nr:hypothetical protein [Shouchella miscanthi]